MIPRRVVSLWLPDWPLTVRAALGNAPSDDTAFALVERGRHGITLACVNAAARARGLRIGQRHADAQAIEPGLLTEPADRGRDAAALARLAHWCLRWSPSVAVDAPDGVVIEAGGSAHLFDGEAGLLADMTRRLTAARTPVRLAVAATPGAAWAAARHCRGPATIVPDDARGAAANWPLAALRLDDDVLRAATAMGLRRIGDLFAMPRAGLARRFAGDAGLGLVERLDQLLGDAPEALAAIAPPRRHVARAVFAEPRADTAGIEAELPRLIGDLAGQLAQDGLGALALELTGYRVDGTTTAIGVRLGTASGDPALWRRLLATRGVEHLDLGFGIDALGFAATATAPVAEISAAFGDDEVVHEPLPELIDRLAARLGGGAVRVARGAARWLPERAERWVPAQGGVASGVRGGERAAAPRPLILLDPPESIEATALLPHGAPLQFRWRRVVRRIARVEGPERIAGEWWRGGTATRDYYRAEDSDGQRWWLYREGAYGAGDPAWWLHGVFA